MGIILMIVRTGTHVHRAYLQFSDERCVCVKTYEHNLLQNPKKPKNSMKKGILEVTW